MQCLNDRLATYLSKVRLLEDENNNLESLIREWYQKQGQSTDPKDYSAYYAEIEQLSNELISSTMEYNKIILDIDNTKMAAEDFRNKYETESGLRQSVEADLQGLRPFLDKLTLEKSDLEMQYESLQEDLIHLKKNHDEIKNSLQHQSGGNVTVEVSLNRDRNLKETLDALRHEYEEVIAKNRSEVEQWYESKMDEARQEENSSSQEIESGNNQLRELSREYQTLEMELQSQLSMIQPLQSNLNNTEGGYNKQLQQMAGLIEPLEAELSSIRGEMESQNQEYQTLLGIKTRLEQEISQYHQLLEEGKHVAANIQQGGHDGGSGGGMFGGSAGGRGSSRGGGGSGGGGHSYGGISQGGISGGRGSGGESQAAGGISHGGNSRGGGSGGGHSYDGISQRRSSGGGGGGRGQRAQLPGGISQGGSSEEGGRRGRTQSYGGIAQGESTGGGGGSYCQSSSLSSSHSQSG
ncbi:keratin, type I cytoskeletal 10-like [Varanus komodoensis]|uniref:keratin, type I cytoskeletal 10-like n=1 Tax=Varanus komodoensis TaxID=61221 RepID=UPI001CF76CEE|nr:keratin, type I cytoskeletal 10-like [Varanus komodoensis]